MKKFQLVLLAVYCCIGLRAQEQRMAVGIETGLTLAGGMITPRYDSFRATFNGYTGGLSLICPLSKNLDIHTGLFYMGDYGASMIGNSYDNGTAFGVVYTAHQGRSFNTLLSLRESIGRKFRFFIEEGLIWGYEISENIRQGDDSSFSSEKLSYLRALIDLRLGCNFSLSSRLMLEAGLGMNMTTRQLNLNTEPDFISGKMEFPIHLGLYYKL